MTFIILLIAEGMLHWWYWWAIPSVLILLFSWEVKSWQPAAYGIPITLVIAVLCVFDQMMKGMH